MADLTPITRKEKYLAKAGGQEVTLPPYPITREEMYLEKIANGGGGSSTDYATDINFSMDSGTFVITAQLKNKDGDPLGTAKTVDIPLEATVVGGSYDTQTKSLILTLVSGQAITIPIGDIISGLQAEITAQNPLDADLVSDSTSTNKFVTAAEKTSIGTSAEKLTGIAETADNYIEMENGVRLYISDTAPTGTIPEGSLGVGW